MRIAQTKTDKSLETEGVWVRIRYGAEVKVARQGNPRTEVWRAKLGWDDRRLLDNPDLQRGREARVNELGIEAVAETLLLDWRGEVFTDEDGQPIPHSPATAKELLTEYEWFLADVCEAAATRETFFRAEVAEVGKPSRKSSAGKGETPAS